VADVPALIKRLEWCEDDCEPVIEALARSGDPAALEPLAAKLADPALAEVAAGAIATIAGRADVRGRGIKLLERGRAVAPDRSVAATIDATIAGLRR
jgi:hypothetical protein